MSAGVMPDIYRHTARKSTVSKNLKTVNNGYSTYHNEKPNCLQQQQQTKINPIDFNNIKLEEDHIPQDDSFIIIPDNHMEEMIIENSNIEQTDESIIDDIIQQIINQILQSSSETFLSNSNQIRSLSIDTQDAEHVISSIMNNFNEIDNKESVPTIINDDVEENVNISSDQITSMDCDQQPSTNSRSQIDDDIVEIEATTSNDNSDTCTCQCHKSSPLLNNDYLLFEKALKQARLEQEQERSLNNNRLIQTLKRQHEELMTIYQQTKNQKQINISKIDREQQTMKLNLHDSQIQTDVTTIQQNNQISSQQKSPTKTLPNGLLTATRNSTQSTLQQILPRLSANAVPTAVATTTITTMKTTIVTNSQPPTVPPPSSTATSHDIVDLTEEDEEDNTTRPAIQRTAPTRQSTSSIHPLATSSSSSSSPSPVATTTATRNRPISRTIRPNNTIPNGQTFPLRPLPEHIPCDSTIARPQLSITQENATVRLTWNLPSTPMESIQNYEIYAYKQSATATASDWKKIGTVKSMRLPMAVTLKEFQSNSHYAFAVRAVSINNNIGPFCEPKTIFTGSTLVQPLHTSQLLNVST